MKITKTKRMLSILLTFMMLISVFSILSVTSASAEDVPEQIYVIIKPNITYAEAWGEKSFSVTASVESRSSDYVGISSPSFTKYESCDDTDDLYAWHHVYNVTFRIYVKSSAYDISNVKYIYVKDGKCTHYAALTKGSSEKGFYQSGNYLIANINIIPFEVYSYRNNKWGSEDFFGLERARYWCPFQCDSRHLISYELATRFYNTDDSQVRTYNGTYDVDDVTASGFYYSVPRSKTYTGRFGYTNGYGGTEEGSKTIKSYNIRRRFFVGSISEDCTAGTPTVTTAATCTATGTKTTKCTVCGKTLKTETVSALGHNYSVLQSTTPATCTTGTKSVYKCSRCSSTKTVTSNDALGHNYSVLQSQTPATCTTGTKSVYKCSRCSLTKTVTANDALGHNYVYDSERSTPATVYEEGQEVYHCTRCDNHYVARILSKKTEDSGFLKGGCAYQFDANTGTLTLSPVFGKTTTGNYNYNDSSLPWNNTAYKMMITTLVIDDGMTEIGDNVFRSTAVTSVTTPSTMTRIGYNAFAYCNNLENITVNGTDCVIENYAFDSCEGKTLDFITLNGVKSVGYDSFYEVDSYQLNLGNIKHIGGAAFALNEAVHEIVFPESLETFEEDFISGCDALEKVTFLSRNCTLYYDPEDDWEGLGHNDDNWYIPENATIYCYTNSTAHQYAQKYNHIFELIDEIESVTLNKHTLTLGIGQTYTLKPTISPEGVETTFTWKSGDKTIATVTSLGKVKGCALGKSTVTVKTANGKTDTCIVIVKPAPTSISLNKTEMTLGVGQMYTLQTTMTPSNAATYQQWTSSNKTVAVVNDKGRVTGKKVGTAVITVKTTNGHTATCTVTVKKAPTSVAINKTALTLAVGQKETLTASLTPADSATYCTWSSSDETIATVSSNGLVTAKKSGKATITVKTTNDKTATCTVTVKKAPSAVTLDKTELTLDVGDMYTLSATLTPSDALTQYTYTSSDTNVATVSSSGEIVAKQSGTATITVTTHNNRTAVCTVTVKSVPLSITLDKTELTLKVGESYTLKKTVTPSDAETEYTYSSSYTSVATVTSSGKIVAKKAGKTTVTVTTHNGKTAECIVTVKS